MHGKQIADIAAMAGLPWAWYICGPAGGRAAILGNGRDFTPRRDACYCRLRGLGRPQAPLAQLVEQLTSNQRVQGFETLTAHFKTQFSRGGHPGPEGPFMR